MFSLNGILELLKSLLREAALVVIVSSPYVDLDKFQGNSTIITN
jgi:hypothetical protein